MTLRSISLVVAGALLVIVGAELTLREVEEHMPVLSEWPTVETELKSAQFAALPDNPSLLIVGSSTTESSLDPAALVSRGAAESAYNAAFPFFSPAATDIWLHDYLQPWEGLEVIIIGLPAWAPPTRLAEDPLASGLIAAFGADLLENPVDGVALWRLRGLLADLEEAARRERTISTGLWTELGHQTFYYERSGGSLDSQWPPYPEPVLGEIHQRALQRIVASARAAGAEPVVMLEPGRYPGGADDAAVAAYTTALFELAAELDVVVWDTYSIDWDQSLYADEVHFNERGTNAFTAHIAEQLEKLGGS